MSHIKKGVLALALMALRMVLTFEQLTALTHLID